MSLFEIDGGHIAGRTVAKYRGAGRVCFDDRSHLSRIEMGNLDPVVRPVRWTGRRVPAQSCRRNRAGDLGGLPSRRLDLDSSSLALLWRHSSNRKGAGAGPCGRPFAGAGDPASSLCASSATVHSPPIFCSSVRSTVHYL